MKEIELTRGKVALVDDENFEYLNQWKWMARESGNNYYAVRGVRKNRKLQNIAMHRIIMNTSNELQVDHIDHNGLNNQKSNLRNCTEIQNLRNRIPYGRSKYLGVSMEKLHFRARISINNKRVHLGSFQNEIDAAIAYDTKAKELYKEYANLNFK